MRIFQKLKASIELLKPWEGYYAICGGIAACLYRDIPRYTADIDIAIIDTPTKTARAIAEETVQTLGYVPKLGFVTDRYDKLIAQPALIIGREESDGKYLGIDLLLPVLDWIEDAVKRAQLNKLDYGFAEVASVIPEDLIVAKLFALQVNDNRKYDLDDILSIIRNISNLNQSLLTEMLIKYELKLPLEVESALKHYKSK